MNLYRRFNNPEIVHEFLKTLAFKMHEKGFRAVDRVFATEILRLVFKRMDGEDEEDDFFSDIPDIDDDGKGPEKGKFDEEYLKSEEGPQENDGEEPKEEAEEGPEPPEIDDIEKEKPEEKDEFLDPDSL